MAKQKEFKNYYEILDLHFNASKDDIRKAYKKLALVNHPDKHKGDKHKEEKFKVISEAYETLYDDEKRIIYNAKYKDFYNQQEKFKKEENKASYSPEEIIKQPWNEAQARDDKGVIKPVIRFKLENIMAISVEKLIEFLNLKGIKNIFQRFSSSLNAEIIEISGEEDVKKFKELQKELLQNKNKKFYKENPDEYKAQYDEKWFENILRLELELNQKKYDLRKGMKPEEGEFQSKHFQDFMKLYQIRSSVEKKDPFKDAFTKEERAYLNAKEKIDEENIKNNTFNKPKSNDSKVQYDEKWFENILRLELELNQKKYDLSKGMKPEEGEFQSKHFQDFMKLYQIRSSVEKKDPFKDAFTKEERAYLNAQEKFEAENSKSKESKREESRNQYQKFSTEWFKDILSRESQILQHHKKTGKISERDAEDCIALKIVRDSLNKKNILKDELTIKERAYLDAIVKMANNEKSQTQDNINTNNKSKRSSREL
ncbi:MAG: DnaJ domain-containing protein [Alphaproteobacteria bacterium]